MGFKDKCKKIFAPKSIALGLSATAIIGGVAATAVQTGINRKSGNPFVLIFTNGRNQETNSKYRLLGRHQDGYINRDLNDKFGRYSSWEVELGLQLDNSNPAVQAEQLNWLYYLLFFNKNINDESFKAKAANVANAGAANEANALQNIKDSTFDGIRIDCGDGVDSDVIGQTDQLLNNLYNRTYSDADANDHLSYNEGYGPSDAPNEKQYFHNSSLDYDDSYYQNMTSHLMWYDDNKIPDLKDAMSWIIGNKWEDDQDENVVNPNLTYSQNHDNFNGRVEDISRLLDPSFTYKNYDYDKQGKLRKKATHIYYKNLSQIDKTDKVLEGTEPGYKSTGKQISPKNQVALYADMLTNKDTVPIVFYGDIFESEKDYMETPTAIAEPIMDILNARSKYVAGGQQRKVYDKGNGHIITNVRFGKDYYERNKKDSKEREAYDPKSGNAIDSTTGRDSGIVTIFSNNAKLSNTDVKVYVGKNHAGQNYVNLINTTDEGNLGLTVGSAAKSSDTIMGVENPHDKLTVAENTIPVDSDGYISVNIHGVNKAFVNGYLGMWVPETSSQDQNVYVTQDQAKNMHSYNDAHKDTNEHYVLNSNDALDSHVLYQDFSTIVPDQGLDPEKRGEDQYAMLEKHADDIAQSGITDVWMAPPYISPDQSKRGSELDWVQRYGYGYMMSDRYNLGQDGKASKYGTAEQLIAATNKLHDTNSKIQGRKLKTMLDFIPHQIIRGDDAQKELVTFDEFNADSFNAPLTLGKAHMSKYLETRTSKDNYQYKFGGKYLKTIKELFPDIFTTEALSTGELLPDDEPIKQWSAKYEVSYPLEFGIGDESISGNSKGHATVDVDGYYISKRR